MDPGLRQRNDLRVIPRVSAGAACVVAMAFAMAGSATAAMESAEPPPPPLPPGYPVSPEGWSAYGGTPYCRSPIAATHREIDAFQVRHPGNFGIPGHYSSPETMPSGGFTPGMVVDAQPRKAIQVHYPKSQRDRGFSARVELLLALSARGKVEEVLVLCSSHDDFTQAALAGIDGVRFDPATVGGARAPSLVVLPLIFRP
jgi:TonB family protein